jgi:hypothetical protein
MVPEEMGKKSKRGMTEIPKLLKLCNQKVYKV